MSRKAACWSTKWARFEVTSVSQMQACAFLQHARTRSRRTAMMAYLCPQRPLLQLVQDSAAESSSGLLRGAVPQMQHWLLAWRCLRNPTSFSASEAIQGTAAFVASLRMKTKEHGATRRALASMTRVMAEVLRERKRAWLAQAHSVSIALDDRGEHRIIRFRCDAYTPQVSDTSSGGAHRTTTVEGILAVTCNNGNASQRCLQDLDKDYSGEVKDAIVRSVHTLCTPLGHDCDQQLAKSILSKIESFCADGAGTMQKCGLLLKAGAAPHISIILRDPAHAMRTSCQMPVKLHENFEKFFSEIFDNRHALIPDIQNSSMWRERLQLAQRHIVLKKGSQGGGLRSVLTHLSYAPQRFDSASSPARKYCAMLSSIALLLTTVVADSRFGGSTRKRAQALLDAMTPKHIVTAGLFADYTAETLRFVRLFDCDQHDIATTLTQKNRFLKRLRILFKECHVLADSPGVPGATSTSIAIAQAMSLGHLYYMDRALNLWPQGANKEAMAAVSAMQDIVDAASARVEAELPQSGLVIAFAAFDLNLWHQGMSMQESGKQQEGDLILQSQESRAHRLAKAYWSIADIARTATDLCSTARSLRQQHIIALRGKGIADNRVVWAAALDQGICSAGLASLVYWYIALIDITGPVERNLGKLVAVWLQHVGSHDQDGMSLAAALVVALEGPMCESELVAVHSSSTQLAGGGMHPLQGPLTLVDTLEAAERIGHAEWALTPFTKRCAELWVAHRGRRFRVYKTQRKGFQRHATGTDSALARRQGHALDALFDAAGTEKALSAGRHMTILQVPRSHLLCRGRNPGPNKFGKVMQRFVDLTKKKAVANTVSLKSKSVPKLRLGSLFTSPSEQAHRHSAPSSVGVKGCLYVASGQVPDTRGPYTFHRWRDVFKSSSKLLDEIVVTVLDKPEDVATQRCCQGLNETEYLHVLLAVVARGMTVMDRHTVTTSPHPETAPGAIKHQPAQLVVPAKIEFSKAFASKHPRTTALFRACSTPAVRKGRWHVSILESDTSSCSPGATLITSTQDCFVFLRQARRLRSATGVRGDIVAASVPGENNHR